MVQIIDETPDPKIVKRVSCDRCGVRLQYLPIDVKSRMVSDYTGSIDKHSWIVCPKCSNEVTVSSY